MNFFSICRNRLSPFELDWIVGNLRRSEKNLSKKLKWCRKKHLKLDLLLIFEKESASSRHFCQFVSVGILVSGAKPVIAAGQSQSRFFLAFHLHVVVNSQSTNCFAAKKRPATRLFTKRDYPTRLLNYSNLKPPKKYKSASRFCYSVF